MHECKIKMARFILHIIAISSFILISHGAVPQFCKNNPRQKGARSLPKIPEVFSTTVEKIDLYSSETVDFAGFFNWKEKKISVINHMKGGNIQEIYDYNVGQRKVVGANSAICKTTQNDFGPFGFSTVSKDIKSIEDVFFFGEKYNLTYNKATDFRAMRIDTWLGCFNNEKVSLYTSFGFSKNWTMYGDKRPALVAYSATGHVASGKGYKNVSFAYNFVDTHLGPSPSEKMNFLPGVYCEESKHSCQLPKVPFEFEMNSEMISARTPNSVFNSRAYIDSKEKYHRVDYQKRNAQGVRVPIHEIHDFNTGISYVIDSTTMKCAMAPISVKSWDTVEIDNHHHIRMKSADEFFGLNVNKYACKGNSTVRGIPVEVMSSKRNITRRNTTLIQEWYFSLPGWKISGMEGTSSPSRVPLKQVFYSLNRTKLFTVNYFNFDPVETSTHILWILRYCYYNNRHYMYFRLNSLFDKYAVANQKIVISSLRDALAKAAGISKLRVSSILIFKSGYGGVIAVRLYVLGLPAVKGSVSILDPKHEIPLKDAVNKIKTAVTSGKLTVAIKLNGTDVTMKAQSHSYYDNSMYGPDPVPTQPPSKKPQSSKRAGVSGGAAAGIAIALFLLAVVLTIVAMNFILKRRGVELFNYARYNNDPTA